MREPIRVMLLDDRKMQQKALCSALAAEDDLDVLAQAASVPEALELTARFKPHIILFNENLPGLSLDEFPGLVKQQHPESKLLMLSRDCEMSVVFQALKEGVRGYIYEGADQGIIVKAIRCVHKGEIWAERMVLSNFIHGIAGEAGENKHRNEETLEMGLTFREHEVLRCLANGLSNREIGDELFISDMTVKTHVYNIFRKLNVGQRLKAAVWAVKQGLT